MLETLKFTGRIMQKRPLRSLLTILQTALAVWIIAVILSFNLQSAGQYTEVQKTFADTLGKINIGRTEEHERGSFVTRTVNLRYLDAKELEESDYIENAFIYEAQWYRDIYVNGAAYRVGTAAEASPSYATAMEVEMAEGHFFTEIDQKQNSRVVVISETISKQLFPGRSALGEKIDLGQFGEENLEYEIIGVYKPLSPMLEFFIPEAYLIFPLNYMRFHPGDERSYSEIFIKTVAGGIHAAVEDAGLLLAERATDEAEVRGEYFSDTNRFFQDQVRNITMFLGAFVFIAILISSIGILSIMLVSVVERTREIGLRKALGASGGTIIAQILNESFVFSILGSLVGLVFAAFSAKPLVAILAQDMISPKLSDLGGLHPQAALLAFILAVAVGQLFALYPAVQAAKMSPVEALRNT